jgi:hypothetical protein
MHAAYLVLLCFAKDLKDTHVRMEVDNTTTVSYINKQGGKIEQLYHLSLQMWEFAITQSLWLSAAHLPGTLNVEADAASRDGYRYDKEWQLSPEIFQAVQNHFGDNNIDMFASRINSQLQSYVSWLPDPGAMAVDAFTLDWSKFNSYLFPPFSLLGRTIQKMLTDKASGTIIAPIWPTQAWYATLTRMTTCPPCMLHHPRLLQLPHKPGLEHPLLNLKLAAFRISAQPSSHRGSHQRQPISYAHLGVQGLQNNTRPT